MQIFLIDHVLLEATTPIFRTSVALSKEEVTEYAGTGPWYQVAPGTWIVFSIYMDTDGQHAIVYKVRLVNKEEKK